MENNDQKSKLLYHIPKGWVIALYAYYLSLILGGITCMLYIFLLIKVTNDPCYRVSIICSSEYVRYSFFVSMLSSAVFSSIYYSKKLYKACIDGRLLFKNENNAIILGNIMYFFLRPIFAVAFSLLFVVCILGGFFFLMNGLEYVMNERMVFLSAIISSAIGYSVGNVLDRFNIYSEKAITNIQ